MNQQTHIVLSPEAISLLQEGVKEPFPADATVANCKAWLARNEVEIYWLSVGILESAIEEAEATPASGLLVTGSGTVQ